MAETWIDLVDPDEAALEAAVPYELHPAAIGRMLTGIHHGDVPRPRLERHGHYLFGILVVPVMDGDELVFQQVHLAVDHHHLVTVRSTVPGCGAFDIDVTRAAVAGEPPGACLLALVDDVAEAFLTVVDVFDDEIDDMEDHVEEWDAVTIRERVSELRHHILRTRRSLTPTRDLARSVLDDRVDLDGEPPLFPREVEIHFADVYDKLLRASDGLDLSRDLLAGVRDYHQAKIATDQNEVMKRLAAIASLLLVPTFIVGLYGQNFDNMPEFGWTHGYGWSWFLIVVTTVGQLVYFRRKRWI